MPHTTLAPNAGSASSVGLSCSCGNTDPHTIARRRTVEDIDLAFWSDGQLTGRFGHYLLEIGRKRLPRASIDLLLNEAALLSLDEVRARFLALYRLDRAVSRAASAG